MTPSQKFLLFWLVFVAGLVIGSKLNISVTVSVWLAAIWLLVAWSGQKEPIETVSLAIFAATLGALVWKVTGGESWLHPAWIGRAGDGLINLRNILIDRIYLALPEPHGSLLGGILFGNRIKLSPQLIDNFRTVGLSHLIAVSGYNLTILVAYVQTIFRPYLGRRSLWISLGLIVGFVLISGAPASILRAAVMASTILVASFIGRPSRSLNILIFAAGLLAVFEPKIILDVGFQLSVAATYGLIRLSPIFEVALKKIRLPSMLAILLAETLAATLVTAPIIIAYFERLSVISPVSNLLILPLVPMLMGMGIIGTIVLLIIPVLGRLIILLTWPLLQWIIWLSDRLAHLKFAATPLTLESWTVVLLMLALVGAVEWLNRREWKTVDPFARLMGVENE